MPHPENRTREIAKVLIAEMEHVESATEERTRRRARREWGEAAPHVDKALGQVEARVRVGRAEVLREPFVAFMKVNQGGRDRALLFCRNYIPECDPASPAVEYVSYLAPVGAVAARPIGSTVNVHTPGGIRVLSLVERNVFRAHRGHEWDATDNQIELAPGLHVFEASLRALLRATVEPVQHVTEEPRSVPDPEVPVHVSGTDDSLLESVVAPDLDPLSATPTLRPRRTSIPAGMKLRDQPVLDAAQDPIFRLPVGVRLAVTGAPGTGKTTLLIKRLSQKTKAEFLTAEERAHLTPDEVADLLDPNRSWTLFTPTELLRGYLKDALGREGLPATSQTVRLWEDERIILGRDVLRILYAAGRGYFRHAPRTAAPFGFEEETEVLRQFQAHFAAHHETRKQRAVDRIAASSDMLAIARDESTSAVARDVFGDPALIQEGLQHLTERFLGVLRGTTEPGEAAVELDPLRDDVARISRVIEESEASLVNTLMDRVPGVGQVLGPVRETARTRLELILAALDGGGRDSKSGGRRAESALDESDLEVAERIRTSAFAGVCTALQAWKSASDALLKAAESIDSVFASIPRTYNTFRKSIVQTGGGQTDETVGLELGEEESSESEQDSKAPNRLLSSAEADMLIYVALEMASRITAQDPGLLRRAGKSQILDRIKDRYRTIVAVDEASDFSWIQLGCMYHLAHPAWRSFAMCGDLMQRVTPFGIRRWEECHAFAPDTRIVQLRAAYRQSKTLLQIARRMYIELLKEEPPFKSPYIEADEPRPLLYRSEDVAGATKWIADRIVEIYSIYDSLPTIAVFVPDDSEVDEVADSLGYWLEEHAIPVDACKGGRILGEGQRVRVFSIQHIKGLEFHGVFLYGFDAMHERSSDLAEKYLYVGLSRAMMFLGVTVEYDFPAQLQFIREEFAAGDWAGFVPVPAM